MKQIKFLSLILGLAYSMAPALAQFNGPDNNYSPIDTTTWNVGQILPSQLYPVGAITNQTIYFNGTQFVYGKLPLGGIAQGGATSGQVISWNGTAWAPSSGGGGGAPTTATYLTGADETGTLPNSIGLVGIGSGSNSIVLDPNVASPSTATQAYNISIGSANIVDGSGGQAVGVGYNVQASGTGSLAIGSSSTCLGDYDVCIGNAANTEGSSAGNNVCVGRSAIVATPSDASSGDRNVVVGYAAQSAGTYCTAVGASALTNAQNSVAVGINSKAQGGEAVSVGNTATCTGGYSVAVGSGASTGANQGAIAIGFMASAANAQAVALGQSTGCGGNASVVLGYASNDDSYPSVCSIGHSANPRALIHVGQIQSDVGTLPTNTPGTGAGAGASVTVTGTDLAGNISVTTAGTPAGSNAAIVTLTFNNAYINPPYVVLAPANAATAAIASVSQVYVTSTDNTFVINGGATGLTTSTTYSWNYIVIQ